MLYLVRGIVSIHPACFDVERLILYKYSIYHDSAGWDKTDLIASIDSCRRKPSSAVRYVGMLVISLPRRLLYKDSESFELSSIRCSGITETSHKELQDVSTA